MSRYVVCQPAFSDVVYYGRLIKSDRTLRVLKDVRIYEGPRDEDGATAFRLSTIGPAPGTVSRPCERVEMVVSSGCIVFAVSTEAMLLWEGKHSWGVRLVAAGPNKIAAIKAVREINGMLLKEAKDLVEGPPAIVKKYRESAEAKDASRRLSAVGATAEMCPMADSE